MEKCVDKGVAEKLPAKLHYLASGAKSRNLVTSRAGKLDLDQAVPEGGFVSRPQ